MRLLSILGASALMVLVSPISAPGQTGAVRSHRATRPGASLPPPAIPSLGPTRHDHVPTSKGLYGSGRYASRSRSNRGRYLPPPPIPIGSSLASGSRGAPSMVGIDSSGRRDQAGRPANFYPTIRGGAPVGSHASAARQAPKPAPLKDNPQTKAYRH